ncbi:MAG: DUF5806 family protein [Halanaeroarchaeum sp.]
MPADEDAPDDGPESREEQSSRDLDAEDHAPAGVDALTDPGTRSAPGAAAGRAEVGIEADADSASGSESVSEGERSTADEPGDETDNAGPGEDETDNAGPATAGTGRAADAGGVESDDVPADVRKYDRFKKVDGAQYDRVNDFLRDRTYITAREWAIARLCADFRTETGVEMTKIGQNLPHLVPFMTDTYSPQAVNQARSSFEEKVRKAGATFLYGAMSDFFTADELDDVMYEVTEVAKFLLEVEGVDLAVGEELESEERISSVMREVREASDELRHEGTTCPNCGHEIGGE